MSKWDTFKSGLENFAGKTADKTKELTGSAALKIKIANKEADRDREYKLLGKLAYAKLKKLNVSDAAELTQKISDTLARLDGILADLNSLKQKEAEMKANKEAEKAARAAAKKASEEAEYYGNDPEDDLDTVVMDEFNEARKNADEEYEKAKKNAENIK